MNVIKDIIDDLAIAALETKAQVASAAVISNSGNIAYQTKNFDLTNQIDVILKVIKGDNALILNNLSFPVVERSPEGIIGTNQQGMGHVIMVPFQGGVLVAYAMPQAKPSLALSFLKPFAIKLNGKL